jgi:hypothetical protein
MRPGPTTNGSRRAADDDRPASPLHHLDLAKLVLRRVPHTADIDRHHLIEFDFVGISDRRRCVSSDTCIVEGHIKPAEGIDRCRDHGFDRLWLRHIGSDEARNTSGGYDLSDRCFSVGLHVLVSARERSSAIERDDARTRLAIESAVGRVLAVVECQRNSSGITMRVEPVRTYRHVAIDTYLCAALEK